MTLPVSFQCLRRYAIGFIAESAEHDLEQLTRAIEAEPASFGCVLVEEGSTLDLPRLKTNVTRRRTTRDVFGRSVTCVELHIAVNEDETAEQVFARATEALSRYGWTADGGPA